MTISTLSRSAICLLLSGAILAACGQGGSSPVPENSLVQLDQAPPCVPELNMAGHKALWTTHQCGSFDYKWITPETRDSVNGAPLGKLEVNYGMLTVKFTGLLNGNMSSRETFGIYFLALGLKKEETTWRWSSKNLRNGKIVSYLGVQRWGDGCAGSCNDIFDTEDLQFNDPNETYQWNCGWNIPLRKMYCDVTKPADPSYYVHTWNIPGGRYQSLVYMGIGRNAYTDDYPSYFATISDFRLTFFD